MKSSALPIAPSTPDLTPHLDRKATLQLYREHVSGGLAKLATLMGAPTEVRSVGSLIFDEDDQAYLDCSGYGVFIVGHCHPFVIDAVRTQLERHPLSTRVLLNPELAKAAQALAKVTPDGLDFVCFTNSGAEAAEVGIKIARLNGKSKLVSMQGGFHGKTMGALSVTGRPQYQTPFYPLLPDVQFVPFGDPDALRKALLQDGERSCVILEPVQAEAGVIIPPPGYLRQVKQICVQHGSLLILDEIQTGMGRLGSWWGADREGVVPDVLLVGKGLSGGAVPVGAAVTTASIYQRINQDPTLHSSTFAGNQLAMAAVQAAIHVIKRDNLVARAGELSEQIVPPLRQILVDTCPSLISEVRAVGLLIGIEFQAEHLGGDFMMELLKRKVLVSHSLNAHRVVRLTPPAILTESECDWLLGAVQEAALELRQRYVRL